nr:16S rRNA (cytidine(1402)-2'-O)-methyltransferase [Methylonatrum kenyense]
MYVVATPIGNLGDISARALDVLQQVTLVAAEDTRHTKRLLAHFGVSATLLSLHEHNEQARVGGLVERLQDGASIALVSDAGTPLVSDPGYRLVSAAHAAGLPVRTVPGPSSIIAALSVAGQACDRFCFEGFPPSRTAARRRWLEALAAEPRTLVLLESSHRIMDCVADLADLFGAERSATLTRELSKTFETVRRGTLGELLDWLSADPQQRKGEFVLVVAGAPGPAESSGLAVQCDDLLQALLAELPASRAAALAARLTGEPKRTLYARAVELAKGG